MLRAAGTLALALVASAVSAQVYKCTDAAGGTVYADAPCAAGAKAMKLPDSAVSTAPALPTACAQLQDERQRLAAEAERNAARGRKESSDSAKQRESLARAYASRCVGISRSATSTK